DTLVLMLVGNRERHLGLRAVRYRVVLADADDAAVRLGDERHSTVDVLGGRAFELVVGDCSPDAEEAVVRRRFAEITVEVPQLLDIAGLGWPGSHDASGGEQDVAVEWREERSRRVVCPV